MPTPVNTTPPSLAGTPEVGQTLTATPGVWADPTVTVVTTWLVGNTAVQTGGASYVLQPGDATLIVVVEEAATDPLDSTYASVQSNMLGPVVRRELSGVNSPNTPEAMTEVSRDAQHSVKEAVVRTEYGPGAPGSAVLEFPMPPTPA